MQRLEVSGAVRPIYGSLGVKRLTHKLQSPPKLYCGTSLVFITTLTSVMFAFPQAFPNACRQGAAVALL